MYTINEILAAAALLSPSDLAELRFEIERLEKLTNAIVLETSKGITFRLCRLTDAEHVESLRRSLAIEEDYGCYLQLHLHFRKHPEEELNFAQVYLTLKHLAGESSRYLDDYKMAFSFPFAMDVVKGNETYAHLLEVRNIRDSLYFTLRKMVVPNDKRLKDHHIHPPFEGEFGQEEIRFFINYFYGYLMGRWETLKSEQLQPFVSRVPAALILFGYCDGKSFEEQYDSCEKLEAAWQRYQEQVERENESNIKADPSITVEERLRQRRPG